MRIKYVYRAYRIRIECVLRYFCENFAGWRIFINNLELHSDKKRTRRWRALSKFKVGFGATNTERLLRITPSESVPLCAHSLQNDYTRICTDLQEQLFKPCRKWIRWGFFCFIRFRLSKNKRMGWAPKTKSSGHRKRPDFSGVT